MLTRFENPQIKLRLPPKTHFQNCNAIGSQLDIEVSTEMQRKRKKQAYASV